MEKIPTISIKNINERKNIISKDIFEACHDVGFFTIVDHDLLYVTSVMPHILNTPLLSLFVGILRKKVLTANWGEP